MQKLAGIIITLALTLPAIAFEPLFETRLDYAVGDSTISVAAFDIDFDGYADIAATGMNSDNVAILMNNQDGTFANAIWLDCGDGAYGIASADFNHDGCIDLMITDIYEDSICYLRHNGYAGYMGGQKFYAGDGPASIISADFNSDYSNDIAVTCIYDDSLRIIFYPESNAFREYQTYYVGDKPYPLAACDFDLDGDIDIITGSQTDSTLTIFVNLGDRNFERGDDINLEFTPTCVSVGLINEDSYQDLLVSGYGGFCALYHRDNNSFSIGSRYSYYWLGNTLADLDQDGYNDIIGCNTSAKSIEIWNNDGSTIFDNRRFIPVGTTPRNVLAVDINNDNLMDLICSNKGSNTLSVVRGKADGNYQMSRDFQFDSQLGCAVGIKNESANRIFIAAAKYNESGIIVFELTDSILIPVDTISNIFNATKMKTADFNGDGLIDFAAISEFGDIGIYINEDNGQFDNGDSISIGEGARSLWPMDCDGDSDIDLAVILMYSSFYKIFYNDGSGAFPDSTTRILPLPDASDIVGGDFDNDGNPDLVMAFGFDRKLIPFWGNGSGNFSAGQRFTIQRIKELGVSDFNNDGYLDIVASNATKSASIILNDTSRGFLSPVDYNLGYYPKALVMGDFDGDSLEDIIIADSSANSFSYYNNTGGGIISFSGMYGLGESPMALIPIDINNDGALDVIGTGDYRISLARNKRLESRIGGIPETLPAQIFLTAFPNPFNPSTIISYNLISAADVKLTIYNIIGQQVTTLFEGHQDAGAHTIIWNASDVASGVYFARLETPKQMQSVKMTLLK